MSSSLRHIALITRREYLHRIRTKAFIITTLLTPALMAGFMFLPTFFMTQRVERERTIVIVSDDHALAESYSQYLKRKPQGHDDTGTQYVLSIDPTPTDAERQKLDGQVNAKEIDGYVWLTREALKSGKVQYWARSTSDLAEDEHMQNALTTVAIKQRLAATGASNVDVDSLMEHVALQPVQVGRTGVNPDAMFAVAFLLVLILYMTVIIHGVAVMRSVLEEKSSRVMEVLLSAVTPKELMAGKIAGVGAVGLTQIAIWAVLAATFSA
ncbi:MAG TPA: ABC transporter permease, partial [Terriglobales bacterium]|nr:ABC transporter permease [Terriglobales bacterium]